MTRKARRIVALAALLLLLWAFGAVFFTAVSTLPLPMAAMTSAGTILLPLAIMGAMWFVLDWAERGRK